MNPGESVAAVRKQRPPSNKQWWRASKTTSVRRDMLRKSFTRYDLDCSGLIERSELAALTLHLCFTANVGTENPEHLHSTIDEEVAKLSSCVHTSVDLPMFEEWFCAVFDVTIANHGAAEASLLPAGAFRSGSNNVLFEPSASGRDGDAERSMWMDDFSNLGTIAALIGGFALESLTSEKPDGFVQTAHRACTFLAVHACTFAAVVSALLYSRLNSMSAEKALKFVDNFSVVLHLPWVGMYMGGAAYIVGAIFQGVQDQELIWQIMYGGAGGMCLMVIAAIAVLARE